MSRRSRRGPEKTKKSIYVIKDNPVRFWYRFLFPNKYLENLSLSRMTATGTPHDTGRSLLPYVKIGGWVLGQAVMVRSRISSSAPDSTMRPCRMIET